MRIDVISVQPKMLEGFLTESILGRAVRKGACTINLVDLREFGEGRWKKVDDKPYGGGPGMLMKCGPWFAAVESCLGVTEVSSAEASEAQRKERTGELATETSSAEASEAQRKERTGELATETSSAEASEAQRKERTGELHIVMTSPKGRRFTQRDAEALSKAEHLVFLCGHYEGFDARIESLATDFFSVGDFVMTGGELAAAAMVDATVRLLPGVLGGGAAATSSESFGAAGLLEAPQYTHPPEFRGMRVPEVLLSGDHAKIESWRQREARKTTESLRPDLLDRLKQV